VSDCLILHGFVVFRAEKINLKKHLLLWLSSTSCDLPSFQVQISKTWVYISNGNYESDQNGQKNGEKYKEERMNKMKCNNFENNFMKPPSPLYQDNYKA
jgi:hypothetical protein